MKKYFNLSNIDKTMVVCAYPQKCPICDNGISPNKQMDCFNSETGIVYIFFSCPSCGKCFISDYQYMKDKTESYHHYEHHFLELISSYPNIPVEKSFNDSIKKLSPSFCEIYNQAYSAEIYNLNQISGIGYRKALEFLIKDYCIYRNPNDDIQIKSKLLGQVINEYIDSDKIKKLAKAAVWLGNDETHYIRKFETRDINDLKRFITATVAFITYELTSDDAEEIVS